MGQLLSDLGRTRIQWPRLDFSVMKPRPGTVLFLILALVFAVYAPSLTNGYAMDDRLVAQGTLDTGRGDSMIVELRPIRDYFTSHYWAGSRPSSRLFRPVTVYSYALRHYFFSDLPIPDHLANVLLHLIAVAFTFWMLRRLGMSLMATTLGAAAFGFHAIHSEVVSAVVGRAELLAFVFGAAGLYAWQVTQHRALMSRCVAGAVAAFLLFLAFCSKESSLAWPPFFVVFAAAVHWKDQRSPMTWSQLARTCAIVGAIGIVPLVAFVLLRQNMIAGLPVEVPPIGFLVNQIADLSFSERLPTALLVWGYAFLLTLFPFDLAADYSSYAFETVKSLFDVRTLSVALLFCALGFFAIRDRVRRPAWFVAAASFFGFCFLTSNVPCAIGTIFGERLCYTPSMGIAFLVGWAWQASSGHLNRERCLLLVLGAWIATSALVLWQRHGVWDSDEVLFLNEVRTQPNSVRMHTTAAQQYSERGATALAIHHLKVASTIDKENALVWNNLGAIFLDNGQLEAAEQRTLRGLAAKHIMGDEDLYKLHCNLALIHTRMKRFDSAVRHFRLTLEHQPSFLRAFQELLGLVASNSVPVEKVAGVLDAVAAEDADNKPYVDLYRGILAYLGDQTAPGRKFIEAGLAGMERHEDVPNWRHMVAIELVKAGHARDAIPLLQARLVVQAYELDSFRELIKLTGQNLLPLDELDKWLAAQEQTHTWDLYRALALYQRSMLSGDADLKASARVRLEDVLKKLPRWRHHGRLVAEGRMELSRLCQQLGDTDAARKLLQKVANDPSISKNRRREARQLLNQ